MDLLVLCLLIQTHCQTQTMSLAHRLHMPASTTSPASSAAVTAFLLCQGEYTSCSKVVGELMGEDTMQSVKHLVPDLLRHLPVLMYQVGVRRGEGRISFITWVHEEMKRRVREGHSCPPCR
jgi:hypothetical protein